MNKIVNLAFAGESIDEYKATLCKDLAANFVRRNNSFFLAKAPSASISRADLNQLALRRFKNKYPNIPLDQE